MDKDFFEKFVNEFSRLAQQDLLADQQVEPRVNPALYKFNEEDKQFFKALGVKV